MAMVKKLIFGVFMLNVLITSAAGAPVILYTDITSGPNTGGEGDNGAYLSIFGKNFGDDISRIKVYIGGGEVARYIYLGSSLGRPDVQQLSIQPGSGANTGQIIVKVDGISSNADHFFTVRGGDIYFISPSGSNSVSADGSWSNPYKTMRYVYELPGFGAGDFIVYKPGIYYSSDESFETTGNGGTSSALVIDKTGTADNPITIYGYPGEIPATYYQQYDDYGWILGNYVNKDSSNHVFANIKHDVNNHNGVCSIWLGQWNDPESFSDNTRIVNIIITNTMRVDDGLSAPSPLSLQRADNLKFYGVQLGPQAAGNTGDGQGHIIYQSHSYTNLDAGWLYIHDFSEARGSYQLAGDAFGQVNLNGTSYTWVSSLSGTNEYYCEASGGGDPGIPEPDDVTLGNSISFAPRGISGSLVAGSWDYGDNDGLGYLTVYVRLSDGADPDTKSNYVYYVHPQTWGSNVGVKIHDSLFKNVEREALLFNLGSFEVSAYNNIFDSVCEEDAGFSPLAIRGALPDDGYYKIYNNTFYTAALSGGIMQMGYLPQRTYPSVVELKGNAIYAKDSQTSYYQINHNSFSVDRIISDNNIWYGSSGALPSFALDELNADPLFTNPVNGDFTLQPSSLAIDSGSSSVSLIVDSDFVGTSRPQNVSYDIGAFEYTDGSSTPGDTTPPRAPGGLLIK